MRTRCPALTELGHAGDFGTVIGGRKPVKTINREAWLSHPIRIATSRKDAVTDDLAPSADRDAGELVIEAILHLIRHDRTTT